jgi:hypothetical protein
MAFADSLVTAQDGADEGLERLVGAVEEGADDHAGDDHDDRALEHLGAIRPLDLLQLGDRLLDELAALARLAPAGLGRGRLHPRALLRLAGARALHRRLLRDGLRLLASRRPLLRAALPAGLPGH